MPTIPRDHFDTQILTRLRTLTGVEVFDVIVPVTPPSEPNAPGVVKPYAVYQPSGGGPSTMLTLADCDDSLVLRPMVKCVAGWRHKLMPLVDDVQDLLQRWRPAAPEGLDVSVSTLKFPLGFTAGTATVERGETPGRLFLTLWFEFTVST
ncbi:hypothetical protein HMPREF0063_11913 [Aeromicrobium marinum DSM 15272]|uniref:Uncharacterized protein n=1 Tax=Aeromicrobium marinum DSM 15272 TaxID=585531 RepID=E2SDX7_9ACTN|nr:hypothetical protein [Aeromicrobium marinum]EFQ82704.1 hypothetical protein HMPREF0063_11913 [Aeromicrobium marinum DSM 15272]